MKVALVGPYPPPYGGISVHIKRVSQILKNNNIDVVIYNEKKEVSDMYEIIPISSYKSFLLYVPFIKADIIHFHSISKRIRLLLGFFKLFKKRIVLTVHGDSLKKQILGSGLIVRKLLLKSLKAMDRIICVNPEDKVFLSGFGIERRRIEAIPAYINPVEAAEDVAKIPQHVFDFIDGANFLISANGCIRFCNNEDLYGFDMLILLVKRLKDIDMDVSLLIFLSGSGRQSQAEKDYYASLKDRIHFFGLDNNVLIYESNDAEFYPALKKSKLFIRPTNTDGYGVSIAEAIFYNVPAVASDICKRPEGTILFKTRSNDDLYSKVLGLINNYNDYAEKVKNIKITDYSEEMCRLYRKIAADI